MPVIRNADTLSLAGIARAMSDLVTRARTNRLMPDELQGGTFTVNNPGVFGTMMSMSIINQPNAAILTMDAVVKRPVVIGDAIAIRDMMYMSISFDHRILDGLTAAQFIGAIKRRLENPGIRYPGLLSGKQNVRGDKRSPSAHHQRALSWLKSDQQWETSKINKSDPRHGGNGIPRCIPAVELACERF